MPMRSKAPPALTRSERKRLSPDDRRKEFVTRATEFFSEQGFGGGTRDLARRLGVTQPLLYRYFPSKGVRKYIYESPVLEDKAQMIADALDVFLAGYQRV